MHRICSLLLLSVGATAYGQHYTVDFEQFTGPAVFSGIRAPLKVANTPLTVTGGQILRQTTFMPANRTSIYGTSFFCPGCAPTITLDFDQPVSDFGVFLMNGQTFTVTYTIQDDKGGLRTATLQANFLSGAGHVSLPTIGVRRVEIRGDAAGWDFFIDNVKFTASPQMVSAQLVCRPLDSAADDPTQMYSKLGKHCYFEFTDAAGVRRTVAGYSANNKLTAYAGQDLEPNSPPGGCVGGPLASECRAFGAPTGKSLSELYVLLAAYHGETAGTYDKITNNCNVWADARIREFNIPVLMPSDVIMSKDDFCALRDSIADSLSQCGVSMVSRVLFGFYGVKQCWF